MNDKTIYSDEIIVNTFVDFDSFKPKEYSLKDYDNYYKKIYEPNKIIDLISLKRENEESDKKILKYLNLLEKKMKEYDHEQNVSKYMNLVKEKMDDSKDYRWL